MKYVAVIILFLFFILCLSAVKYADGYSHRYQICVSKESLEISNRRSRNISAAKPCPMRKHAHRDFIVRVIARKSESR